MKCFYSLRANSLNELYCIKTNMLNCDSESVFFPRNITEFCILTFSVDFIFTELKPL
ncbi:hypothetical protein VIBNIAM115_1970001 [Vibrio nigripulchritudo AM115]|nr:hypothetical protein VIBNIAM115_1970001 [Vibrio nigripulchritudo AM115]